MPTSNEYYIPDIEDLFVGYECEADDRGDGFDPIIVNSDTFNRIRSGMWTVQTKYLDEEDVKSEGYNKSLNNDHTLYHKAVQYGGLVLDMNYEDSIIKIDFLDHLGSELTIFFGKCPSINELRKIERLVTI